MSTKIPQPRIYAPGADVTVRATADVTARRFVAISGNRTGGNLAAAHATAAGRAFGVAKESVASGALFGVARDGVVWVTADGALTAGAEVEVGTAGKAKAKGTGVVVGYAATAAVSGADAEIVLV